MDDFRETQLQHLASIADAADCVLVRKAAVREMVSNEAVVGPQAELCRDPNFVGYLKEASVHGAATAIVRDESASEVEFIDRLPTSYTVRTIVTVIVPGGIVKPQGQKPNAVYGGLDRG